MINLTKLSVRVKKHFVAYNILRYDKQNICICRCYSKNFAEKYSPAAVEESSKRLWEKHSIINLVDNVSSSNNSEIYSLVIPPPNVTGSLHLGHALTATLQDVICRWKRMNNVDVCWLPGTDHAGIATQVVVEKYLSKKNLNRQQLGHDKFQNEVWKWKEEHGGIIQKQLRRLGTTLDWSRETFTMNPDQSKAVKHAFIEMFNEDLIYRTDNLVNWSCQLQSTISDIEVENVDIPGPTYLKVPGYSEPVKFGTLTEIAYKIEGSSEEVIVATTRPETLLGDVAIAVHPNDERYSHLKGKKFKHPFLDKTIPLIFDDSVDMSFGTGAVKITPAHDRNDYNMAKKHELKLISVIDDVGNIEKGFAQFSGMKRYEARDAIIIELDKLKLLRSVKDHRMIIPMCSRSGDVIEFLPRAQWYIKCNKMCNDSIDAVKNGDLQLMPNRFVETWYNWLKEEKDWCISRQLWWGHRIPAYKCYKPEDIENYIWVAALDDEEAKKRASVILQSPNITCEQDTDVLDTWFSSALYPFSSHGWPASSKDYNTLYPLSLMVTGHDILCFWVSRMVMLGKNLTGRLPFPKVLLHGIICDSSGAKMSKSKGNVIDPDDVINGITLTDLKEKTKKTHANGLLSDIELVKTLNAQTEQFPNGIPPCGADALRFTLCSRNIQNLYVKFDIEDCHSNKLFCNKIWQSLKYAILATNAIHPDILKSTNVKDFSQLDLWILSRLSSLIETVNESLDTFNFHIATAALRQFLYSEVCDIYVECTKMNFKKDFDEKKLSAHCHIFSAVFQTALRLLSPFMPFLAEELIPHIPNKQNCIINYEDSIDRLKSPNIEEFKKWHNNKLEKEIDLVIDVVAATRFIKNIYSIPNKIKPIIYLESSLQNIDSILNYSDLIVYLSNSEKVLIKKPDDSIISNLWTFSNSNKIKTYLEYPNTDESKKHVEIGHQKLIKKKDKLLKTLIKLEKTVAADGFKNASEDVQVSIPKKIIRLKEELKKLDNDNIHIVSQ